MVWTQDYNPMGNLLLSAIFALLPILVFLLSLLVLKLKGYMAALLTVIVSTIIALLTYDMPFSLVGASFVQGFTNGMWPIAWIIIAAIFLYKLSIKSGSFEIIKQSVVSITPDHRIQTILIGFSFGSFLEGAIGFGGPVAITAALLVGLGLRPLYAAGLCLIANTAPVAFGAVGIPIIAMTNVIGIEQHAVSAMVGRMLVPLSITIPFFVVFLMDGFKGIKETFPATFVAAVSFTGTQFLSSNYLGAELPDIVSAIVSLVATTLFLKVWQPKNIFRLDGETNFERKSNLTFGQVFKAWLPFILLVILIVIWTQPWFKALFAAGGIFDFTQISLSFNSVQDSIKSPTGAGVGIGQDVNLIAHQGGTAIFLAAILTIIFLRIKIEDAADCLFQTIKDMAIPIITIGLVVAFAFIAKNSGMSATLGTALAETGDAFAFFSPVVGWIGVFITGSDTSSNLLFGPLQQVSAQSLEIKEALFLAANSVGGVIGKMISPQSIAIACAAVGIVGKESELFKFTFKYSIIFIILVGIWTLIIATYLTGIIPDIVLKP